MVCNIEKIQLYFVNSLHSFKSPPYREGCLSSGNVPKKGGSEFSHKNGEVGRIEGYFKKRVWLTLTNPKLSFSLCVECVLLACWPLLKLSFFLCMVCVCLCVCVCVYVCVWAFCLFTHVFESNHQIYHICQWIIFGKQRHCGAL